MDERWWFSAYQTLLLMLANTSEGRDLLCIDKRPYPVVAIGSSWVRFYLGEANDRDYRVTVAYTSNKFGNVVRYRWKAIQAALDRAMLKWAMTWPSVTPSVRVRQTILGTVTTAYPDAGSPGTNTVDGNTAHGSDDSTWATVRGGVGTGAGGTQVSGLIMQLGTGTTVNWDTISRAHYGFDFSAVTDTDNKDSATLSIYGASKSNGNSGSPDVNIYSSAPASNTSLVAGDFDGYGTTAFATAITYANFSTTAYNVFTLNASGLAQISLTATASNFGLRSASYDAANSEPTRNGNSLYDNMQANFADAADTTNDPKLELTHTSSVSRLRIGVGIFGGGVAVF